MLQWALIFFVVAIVASVLGARGVAGMSAQVGYALVVIAIIFVVLAFLFGRAPRVGAATPPAAVTATIDGVAPAPVATAPPH
jgi:uncharacterized membrane protein YtjA (UPF0391 family)